MVLRPAPAIRRRPRAGPRPVAAPPLTAEHVIPYDYAASFPISGRPGAVVQDVINVSPDGVFVAVAIGYGFEQSRAEPLALLPALDGDTARAVPLPGDLRLGDVPPSALIEGFRLNPRLAPLVLAGLATPTGSAGNSGPRPGEFTDQPVPAHLLYQSDGPTLFERVKPAGDLFFLLSIVDSASGRELQDRPSHNLASLGASTGQRPFRLLAHPVAFLPRSTIRIQIIEQSPDMSGRLFIVLYGYKLLGASHCPEPLMRRLTGPPACPVETIGHPSDRMIPFDYVTSLELAGLPENAVETEVTVNAEGGFVATSVGYGLQVPEREVHLEWARQGGGPPPVVDLRQLPLRLLPPTALIEGVRLRPSHLRVAFAGTGQVSGALPSAWLDNLFERLNRPEDVSFRYLVFDGGRGRELQNQPIHNVAGLGSAGGERPFKRLARPLAFLPRSTIRVRVEERFGRGTLQIVFQGYKVLQARGKAGP